GKLADKIAKADTNHDGKLSPDEFYELLKSLNIPKITPAISKKLFEQLDRNKDGFLTKDEITQLESKLKGMIPGLAKEAVKKVASKVKDGVAGKLCKLF